LFCFSFTFSQIPSEVVNYSIKDGLSQNTVNCIYQTQDGLLWFGTQDGLNMYDGYKFTYFKHNPNDTNTLSNNYIYDITEDNSGNLIIATREGINLWNRQNKTIKRLQVKNGKNSLSSNSVFQVLYFNNTLWALTETSLDKYLGENNFESNIFYNDENTKRSDYNYLDMIVDKNNTIWIATKDGLNSFYSEDKNFCRIYNNANSSLSNPQIRSLLIDNQNNIWVGTFNGLNLYSDNNKTFSNYYYNNNSNLIKENSINTIAIDKNNYFWLGTKTGLKTFNGHSVIDFESTKINEINFQINDILIDLSGNIWCGTMGHGVYKINLIQPFFLSLTDFAASNDNSVFAIITDKNNLWLGGSGIYIFDKLTKKQIHSNTLKINDSIQETTVYCFLDDGTNMWIGTDNNIFIANKTNFEIKTMSEFFDIDCQNLNTRIFDIKFDGKQYWISTLNGLVLFDGKKFITANRKNPTNSYLSANTIIKVFFDDKKTWVATYNGLCLYNKNRKNFREWTQKNGILSNFILDIYKESDSVLWVTTTNGLSKFNIKTHKFQNFTTFTNGFINDFFYKILVDDDGIFWMSSNYGIVKFDYKNNTFDTYEIKDGLPGLECNIGAAYKDKDGTMYFGTNEGVCWCNPSQSKKIFYAPKTIITKIDYIGKSIKKNTIFFPDSNNTQNFTYKDVLTIYVTMPEFTFPNSNKYKYKIDKISNNWSEPQKNNFITLTGLSPGKYDIYFIGANSDNIWNENPTKLSIYINPPFYRSAIMIGFYILLVFVAIFFIVFNFANNIKKNKKIAEEKNISYIQIDFQRKLLEEKNKNITDSINYAKKIIDALLPNTHKLNELIPESFIYFLPKDIVSGDFYWFTEKNDNIFVAAFDCTGHGIPGAFMAIIGIKLLENIINDGITDPAIILNIINKEIISTLKKDFDKTHLKDGMDAALCIIDKRRNQLKFAGAYNPAYIIRDDSIIQLKGDRKSLGNDFDQNSFTPITLKLREDDIVYIFSDGLTDQFGGEEFKKFKFRRFRFSLLSINNLPMNQQQNKLHEIFESWRGNLEQVDDILVIGFKPLSYKNIALNLNNQTNM